MDVGVKPVKGHVAAGFEPVQRAFELVLAASPDMGAACAIHYNGECVVDLWGGVSDPARGALWDRDTLVLVYSLTKGMTGLACAVAVSRGLFDYDEPIGDVWPEFAGGGKEAMTVGAVLSEQAGVAAIDLKLTAANMGDQAAIAAAIARQPPNWPPGEWAGNHSFTLGWLGGELIRRRDPAGRSLGRFFADEIAAPLGVDFFIGLPDDVERERIARIKGFTLFDLIVRHTDMPWSLVFGLMWPWSLAFRALNNPLLPSGPGALDAEAYRRIELGAVGGISNARAIAAIYQEFGGGGKRLGIRPEVIERLQAGYPPPRRGTIDRIFGVDLAYALGLEKPDAGWRFAPSSSAYGTFAVGGSFAFADPRDRVAYAWVTNRLGTHKRDDPRELAVRTAFYHCVGKG